MYSMKSETFKEVFGFEILPSMFVNCNHCINHWGIDLCACGSGEDFDKCEEGHSMCGKPMQVIGKYSQPQ